jgi:hypothetical protein
MPNVSTDDPRGQQPELRAFDPHAYEDDGGDDFFDTDTVLDESSGGPDDEPPAGEGALTVPLTISAPRGPQPARPGYTVAAVVLDIDTDGEENVARCAFLTQKKLRSESVAVGLANYKAHYFHALPFDGATHVLVHDHTGREVKRFPVLRAA